MVTKDIKQSYKINQTISDSDFNNLFGNIDQEGLKTASKHQEDIRNSFGFAYEFGYNVKAFAAIRRMFKSCIGVNNISTTWMALEEKGLLKGPLLHNLKENLNVKANQDRYDDYFFNMFYLGCIQGDEKVSAFLEKVGARNIYYAQMNFANPLGYAMPQLESRVPQYQSKVIKEFLNIDIGSDYNLFNKKGEFLRADSIIAVTDANKNLHILVTDNKVNLFMGLKSEQKDPVEYLKALGMLKFKKSKSSTFTNLNINTGDVDLDISSRLARFCHVTGEKALLKTIQAGAYADSFLRFLQKYKKLDDFKNKKVYVYALGMADTDTSIIKLSADVVSDRKEIRNMGKAYRDLNRTMDDNEKEAILNAAIDKLLDSLKHEDLAKTLYNITKGIKPLGISKFELSEVFDDFANIVCDEYGNNLREEHKKAILDFLKSDEEILFLIGCPGIGKTTSVLSFLETLNKYLVLYASCRLAVNEDFISKQLKKDEDRNIPKHNDAIIMYTTSSDETEIDSKKVQVVNTYFQDIDKLNINSNLSFLDANRERVFKCVLERFTTCDYNNSLESTGNNGSGVFFRLFEGINQITNKTDINKIIATASIQGQKATQNGSTASKHLIKLFGKAIKYNPYTKKYLLNEQEYEKLAQRLEYLIVMVDEITGSPEGASLYKEIKTTLSDLLDELFTDEVNIKRDEYLKKLRKKLKIKIIVADANISTSKVIENHLNNSSTYIKDCVYTSYVDDISKAKGLSNEYIEGLGRVINVNAYPAKDLKVNYKIFVRAQDFSAFTYAKEVPNNQQINKGTYELNETINQELVDNVLKEISSGSSHQSIIYIQNKNRLQKVIGLLEESAAKYNLPIISGQNLIYIASDVSKDTRESYIELINNNETTDENILKFVAMTSSASRGLSFKLCNSLHVVLQDNGFEGYLSELIQAIFRPRGNEEYDKNWRKYLTFYYAKTVSYENKSDFNLRCRKALLDIVSYITSLRASILTRIQGYVDFEGKPIAVVPVGGTHMDSTYESIYSGIGELLKLIRSERTQILSDNKYSKDTKYRINNTLSSTEELILEVFGENDLYIGNQFGKLKLGNTYKEMLDRWGKDFSSIIDMELHPGTFTVNGLLVARIKDNTRDEINFLLKDIKKRKELSLRLDYLESDEFKQAGFSLKYTTKNQISKVRALLAKEHFFDNKYSNKLVDNSQSNSRYVAVPIYTITSMYDKLVFDGQYEKDAETQDIESMRSVMEQLIRLYAPCSDFGPLDYRYISGDGKNSIPFISFKSDTLEGIQDSMFDSNYLISSNEFNIFNLLSLMK